MAIWIVLIVVVSVFWARQFHVFPLDDIVHAAIQIPVSEPVFTAAFQGLEDVQTTEVNITIHPFWEVSTIDTSVCIEIRIVCMIIPDGHIIQVVNVVFIASPIVIILYRMFVGAVADCREESIAALMAFPE